MATYSPNIYSSTSGQVNYAFTFESMEESQVKVEVGGSPYTNFTITGYTTTGGGTVVLAAAPPEVGTEVKVYRQTDLTSMVATFVSGSAITAINLNDDFTQLRNAIQELETGSDIIDADLSRLEARVTQNELDIAQNASDIADNAAAIVLNASNIATNASNISTNAANIAANTARITQNEADIAANAANFANYWNKTSETIASNEVWLANNGNVATTAAIDARINSRITAANPTQTFSTNNTTGTLTLSPGGDTTTVTAASTTNAGLLTAADKQKLDRIQFNTRRNTVFTSSFDGVSTDYTVQNRGPSSAFEILLTVGGIIQQPNVDFTYNPTTGVVSFAKAPPYSAPYGITYNSVLTSELGTAFSVELFLTETEIQEKLDLAATAVDAMFDQLRVAIDEATDFDTLKARLLAVLQ